MYFVYLLKEDGGNRTYVGFTSDLDRRLRQHNGELKGGAKSTRGRSWVLYGYVSGIMELREGLQLEWRIKHPYGKKKICGIENRINAINYVLGLDKFVEKGWQFTFV